MKGEKKTIERELLKQIRDYFLDEDIGVCSGWLPHPSDPYFRRLDVVTNKGANIPFEIDGSDEMSPQQENFFPVDNLRGSGGMGNSGIRESLRERIADKSGKKYGQKYDDLWLFVYDRWQQDKGMAGIASATIYGLSEKNDRDMRETKVALQEEFSQKSLKHHFSKITVFNTLGDPNERDLVSINPIIVYDKDENIFDPRVFWGEIKLLEMPIVELKDILSKNEYEKVKVQEHLEIIGDRLINFLKNEKPIDVVSLKKLNAVARVVLSRLEDFDDKDGFTSTSHDVIGSGMAVPSVRWNVCNFIVHSASCWGKLKKEGATGISKDEYLALFSDTLKKGSRNRQTALSRYFEYFDFLYDFDEVWARENLYHHFNKEFAWSCYFGRHIHGKFISNTLRDKFLNMAKILDAESKFGRDYIRSFALNICYNSKGYRDAPKWLSMLFQHQNNKATRIAFCQYVRILLLTMRKEKDTNEIESCWNNWLKDYWKGRIASGNIDESECKGIFNWIFVLEIPEAIALASKMSPHSSNHFFEAITRGFDDKFISIDPENVANLFLKINESGFFVRIRTDGACYITIDKAKEIIDRLLNYNLSKRISQRLNKVYNRLSCEKELMQIRQVCDTMLQKQATLSDLKDTLKNIQRWSKQTEQILKNVD